ncbi:MAG: tRNA (N(6)-L-threonylcarbamoyladenosine(37)-C(2))-methylthiotransferase MtaB [Ferruginibacter sp.]|nr:tRNA (N(6)-L-threonylcarbamoyladenosine(37)-C(2))-methylthiotransferase MtaB [Cytophagales bacterium]
MKKVAFYTLGCKLNFSETSAIARMFEQRGYQRVEFHDRPDIFVINTCSVTENADKKCRKVVREALAISPDAYVTIIGCYAQLKPREIAEIPGVDAVLGAAEKFRLLDLLDGFEKKPVARVLTTDIRQARTFHPAYSLHDRTRTFLKVQDGCNYACSFCTIPLARGESRSDRIVQAVQNARDVAAAGVKEIVLTGVNLGDFGLQGGRRTETFLQLIRELDGVDGVRFRISSVEPNLLTNDIIDFVAQSRQFAPHFHVPLQSGSNRVLKLMRRRYLRELYAERVARIKSRMPRAGIGADVIVGFPGETEADFLDTCCFLDELDVSYLHVFTYSERANTFALQLGPVVPPAERARRSKELHRLSERKRRLFYEGQTGTTATVLFENDVEEGRMHGFTENYVRVTAKYDPLLVYETKRVRLTHLNAQGLMEAEETDLVRPGHPV